VDIGTVHVSGGLHHSDWPSDFIGDKAQ